MSSNLEVADSALVTGGNGFVGSHLVRRLVSQGTQVHLLIRPGSSLWRIEDVVPKLTVWYGELADVTSLEQCVRGSMPRLVFHLASCTGGRRWSNDLREIGPILEANLVGTLNLLRVFHNAKIAPKSFVRTGSLLEYGNGPVPFDESQRELPASAYAASEVATTMFLNAICRQLQFPVVMLRLASVYGPARKIDSFIPLLIKHCLEGNSFDMTSGTQVRDLIYVDDVIDACLQTAASNLNSGELINIGTGNGFRLRDVAEIIVAKLQSGIRLNVQGLTERAGEVRNLVGKTAKAQSLLNWSAKTDLDTGLDQTIAWYRNHMDRLPIDEKP